MKFWFDAVKWRYHLTGQGYMSVCIEQDARYHTTRGALVFHTEAFSWEETNWVLI